QDAKQLQLACAGAPGAAARVSLLSTVHAAQPVSVQPAKRPKNQQARVPPEFPSSSCSKHHHWSMTLKVVVTRKAGTSCEQSSQTAKARAQTRTAQRTRVGTR